MAIGVFPEGIAGGALTTNDLDLWADSATAGATFANATAGSIHCHGRILFGETFTLTTGGGFVSSPTNGYWIRETGTMLAPAAINGFTYPTLLAEATIQYTNHQDAALGAVFYSNRIIQPINALSDSGEPTFLTLWTSYWARHLFSPYLPVGGAVSTDHVSGYVSDVRAAMATGSNAAATSVVRRMTGFMTNATSNTAASTGAEHIGAQTTVERYRHYWARVPTTVGSGSILYDHIGLEVDALSSLIPTDATGIVAALRSAVAAASLKCFFLLDTGGAPSSFAGKFTKYNNITTVGAGMTSIVAVIDNSSVGAARAAAALFTPPVTGFYRVSVHLHTVTAATISSTMGANVKVVYTTGDAGVVTTQNVPMWLKGATTATQVVGDGTNTVNVTLIGSVVIYCNTTPATYSIDYTSNAAGTMKYGEHIRVEAL